MTAVGEHCKDTGHNIPWDNVRIIASENTTSRRKIREALEISVNNPSLNRDSGYEIPPIYRTVLTAASDRPTAPAAGEYN